MNRKLLSTTLAAAGLVATTSTASPTYAASVYDAHVATKAAVHQLGVQDMANLLNLTTNQLTTKLKTETLQAIVKQQGGSFKDILKSWRTTLETQLKEQGLSDAQARHRIGAVHKGLRVK